MLRWQDLGLLHQHLTHCVDTDAVASRLVEKLIDVRWSAGVQANKWNDGRS